MADAPEVVPSSLTPDASSPYLTSRPAASPAPIVDSTDEKTNLNVASKEFGSVSPLGSREHVDEKQALGNDETSPKTAIGNEPQNEETNPKFGYEHDDRAGSGLESANGGTAVVEKPAVNSGGATERDLKPDTDDWHFGFWDCLSPGSLFAESICCPCVLAGRTHLRLHEPDNAHLSSTNMYCAGCFALSYLTLGIFPLFCFMTSAQRREIRYRYHIPGNNGDDCLKATFCVWCSLVQEEKEVVWRDEQRKLLSTEQPGKREEAMTYSATNS